MLYSGFATSSFKLRVRVCVVLPAYGNHDTQQPALLVLIISSFRILYAPMADRVSCCDRRWQCTWLY